MNKSEEIIPVTKVKFRENGPNGIQADITKWAKSQTKYFDYKKIPGGEFLRDEPDTRVIFKDGHVKFIEVKAPGQKLRPGQLLYLQKLWFEYNCDIAIVYSKEDFISEIEYYEATGQRRPSAPNELIVDLTPQEKAVRNLPRPKNLKL